MWYHIIFSGKLFCLFTICSKLITDSNTTCSQCGGWWNQWNSYNLLWCRAEIVRDGSQAPPVEVTWVSWSHAWSGCCSIRGSIQVGTHTFIQLGPWCSRSPSRWPLSKLGPWPSSPGNYPQGGAPVRQLVNITRGTAPCNSNTGWFIQCGPPQLCLLVYNPQQL